MPVILLKVATVHNLTGSLEEGRPPLLLADPDPGHALSAVATTGYLGLLAGPPLIGVTAQAAGLTLALGLVSAACALIAMRAGAVAPLAREDAAFSRG